MNQFNVLIVDDEEGVTSEFSKRLGARQDIAVLTAASVEEAKQLIRETFVQAAFVDMHLGKNMPDGMALLKALADDHPSCRCFLLTGYSELYREALAALLHPLRAQIHGVIDKMVAEPQPAFVAEHLADQWLRNQFFVDNVDAVLQLLSDKIPKSRFAQISAAEVDFVVSTLLGQGTETGSQPLPSDLTHVYFQPLPGGRSRSVVVAGRPRSVDGNYGVWCVVKLGPRDEIHEEYTRYLRYVRFVMSRSHRVELLNVAYGDNIGAMCYSFAGKAPEHVTTLNGVLQQESDSVFSYLNSMFGPEARELYDRSGSLEDLMSYFIRAYRFKPVSVLPQLQKTFEGIAKAVALVNLDDGDLVTSSDRIVSPKVALRHPSLQSRIATCIVHGDMNAGNVIVGDDERVIFIDYRHTGPGPRPVDFAAIEGSVRLLHATGIESQHRSEEDRLRACLDTHPQENRLWRSSWAASTEPYRERNADATYWYRVSSSVQKHARNNFPDLDGREYAGTCLLWALRLFRLPDLGAVSRARLITWMSSLSRAIVGQ